MMDEWIERNIDFSGCTYIYDVHEVLKNELELPDFYGRNLYALWDSLTGIMYTPAYINIRGIDKAHPSLRGSLEKIIMIFRRAETMNGDIRVQIID